MLKRNKMCWCGSGLKYKKCHYLLETEKLVSSGQLTAHLHKEFSQKRCLAPKGSLQLCSKKVVKAHSIQRSKVIESIMNEKREVLTFYQSKDGLPKAVGWGRASTFRGFCSVHDKQIFAVVEDRALIPNEEQLFVLGYRSFCHELYQKTASLRFQPYVVEQALKGRSALEQQHLFEFYRASEAGVRKAVKEMEAIKENIFDVAYFSRQFENFSYVFVELSGPPSYVACGVCDT